MAISCDTLRTLAPFDSLSEEYLSRVQGRARLKRFACGTLIFKRGQALSESFYLVAGDVDLINAEFAVTSLAPGSRRSRFPLNDASPSKVSAIARSAVELLSLERDFLDLVMAWSQSSDFSVTALKDQQVEVGGGDTEESDWMSCLLRSPLFTRIPPAHIQQLFAHFESFEAAAGAAVVREGEPGDYFYVVERGRARVQARSGRLQATLGAGDYFGEEALIGDTTRNATVTMSEDGVLMRLGKEEFKALLQEPVLRYISCAEFDELAAAQLLDVRLPIEYRHRHMTGARNLPLSSLRSRCGELDPALTYVVADDAGRRSEVAAHLLCQAGFQACILTDANLYYDRVSAV